MVQGLGDPRRGAKNNERVRATLVTSIYCPGIGWCSNRWQAAINSHEKLVVSNSSSSGKDCATIGDCFCRHIRSK